jgi:hypothetical protein
MVLGAIWCPMDVTREIAVRIRDIKKSILCLQILKSNG